MLFEGFVHPALAWGALLAAVPLVIHLFNRQRHKPLEWAAMRFVLEAYRRTRRRAQLENLLLLLLRMAAVALLAFAVARPFTGGESALLPLTESRRDLVLILDGSASTSYRESVSSVFEEEIERARELLGEFDGTRGDRVRLILAGASPRLLSARSPEDALALLSTLTQPTDEPLDLAPTLAEVARFVEEDAGGALTGELEIRLLTDLQRHAFVARGVPTDAQPGDAAPDASEEPEQGRDGLARVLDRLEAQGLRVLVEDLGPAPSIPPNLTVESLRPLDDVLGTGLSTEIAVSVRNHGATGRSSVRVALEVDGQRTPSRSVDVPARGASDVVFPVVFRETGHHVLVARLEGDRMAVDDERAHVLAVPPPVRVLLVDGDPHDEIDRSETGYLRVVLEPTDDGGLAGGRFVPFETRAVNAAAFGGPDLDLEDYDVLLLANVGILAPGTVEALERRVAAGAALILTLGDRFVTPSAIEGANARLWREDGTGLLPAKLARSMVVPSRRERYWRVSWFDESHPALAFFADERWRPFLSEVPVFGFVASEPLETARVLAHLDDSESSPLLVERAYDRGRVYLWTSSIDADWSRLPESPSSFIPLVHELLRHAARGSEASRNVAVGSTVVAEVHGFPRGPSLTRPDGSRRPLDGEPEAVAEGVWRLPPIGTVDSAGVWRVEMEGVGDYTFSVGLDPQESDLERLSREELESLHPVWRYFERGASGGDVDADTRPDRGELWRWLAALTLLALVLETLWAAWIGRSRRRV